MNHPCARIACAFTLACYAMPALAQPVIVADSGDSAWMLAASILTLAAALPGLAMVRARDTVGAAILISTAIAVLLFVAIGYSLTFGEGSTLLGGLGNMMLGNLADLRGDTTIPESLYALYQTAVAAFALCIVASALAERARLAWFVPFAALWLLIVYVPIARWLIGGGWLAELGALDFSGGIVVHVTAGVAALVVGLLLRDPIEDALSALLLPGAALLWGGWLAVIGGAALGASDDAASAILDGLLAGSAGLLTGLALGSLGKRTLSLGDGIVGMIAALAAISTSAGFVGPLGSIALGIVAALAAVALAGRIARLHTGAAGEALVAHGIGGIAGAVLFPVFVIESMGGPGLGEGIDLATQLAAQGIAVLVVVLWTAVATVIAALTVSMVVPLRRA